MTQVTFEDLMIPSTLEDFHPEGRKKSILHFAFSDLEKASFKNYQARNTLILCAVEVELRFFKLSASIDKCIESGVHARPINSRSHCPNDVINYATSYASAYDEYAKAKIRATQMLNRLCDVRSAVTPREVSSGKVH